ncbi:hypothetical protein SARI_02106 [Salmonella enterica subsp. arizonae serovar 62:z4,z23:-]|uniref:Uncharacterized protein n=2 Tax=Salmonella enterica subsp. arizonae TaxID=59203 RepID=A9MIT0_SALAR|nr:hypothetical protein SARI_02106 [Salmonella enterica subsp. arizonae serovar 62:z4,z23:-]
MPDKARAAAIRHIKAALRAAFQNQQKRYFPTLKCDTIVAVYTVFQVFSWH